MQRNDREILGGGMCLKIACDGFTTVHIGQNSKQMILKDNFVCKFYFKNLT